MPPALQGLTQVEEVLISPIMSVYRLPQGQFGYSGHVINLPQDVASFVDTLPRMPSQLDIVVVRREGNAGSHKDFKVRRSRGMLTVFLSQTVVTCTTMSFPTPCVPIINVLTAEPTEPRETPRAWKLDKVLHKCCNWTL